MLKRTLSTISFRDDRKYKILYISIRLLVENKIKVINNIDNHTDKNLKISHNLKKYVHKWFNLASQKEKEGNPMRSF